MLEAMRTTQRLEQEAQKREQAAQAKKASSPQRYEGTDELEKFRAELKTFQGLTGMTNEQIEQAVEKHRLKLAKEAETRDP